MRSLKSCARETRKVEARGVASAGAVAALAGLLGLYAGGALGLEQAGNATAVKARTTGRLPEAVEERSILLGAEVFRYERVKTDRSGIAQLLLLDNSSLTIAPGSELVIDEFVYDPQREEGNLAVSMAKGFLRFVGGRISKGSEVRFETPTATVGIRGGIGSLRVGENGETEAILGYGRMRVSSGGVTVTVRRAGYRVSVSSADAPPSAPERASAEEVERALAQGGGSGGAEEESGEPERGQAEQGSGEAPGRAEVDEALAGSGLAEANSQREASEAAPAAPAPESARPQEAAERARRAGTDAAVEEMAAGVGTLSGRALIVPPSYPNAVGGEELEDARRRNLLGGSEETDLELSGRMEEGQVRLRGRGGEFVLPLPGEDASASAGLSGLRRFEVSGVPTPLGPASGYGYASAGDGFLYYRLRADREGGGPDPNGRPMLVALRDGRLAQAPAEALPEESGEGWSSYRLLPDEEFGELLPFFGVPAGEVGPLDTRPGTDYTAAPGGDGFAFVSPLYVSEENGGSRRGAHWSVLFAGEGEEQRSGITVLAGPLEAGQAIPRRGGERLGGEEPLALYGGRATELTGALAAGSGSALLGVEAPSAFHDRVLGGGGVGDDRFAGSWHVARREAREGAGLPRTTRRLETFSAGLDERAVDPYRRARVLPGRFLGTPDTGAMEAGGRNAYLAFDAAEGSLSVHGMRLVSVEDAGRSVQIDIGGEYSGLIDDDRYAAASLEAGSSVTGAEVYLLGDSGAATAELEALGVGAYVGPRCACRFLEWGFWGGYVPGEGSEEASAFHVASWVGGELVLGRELPAAGRASYEGHVLGDVARRSGGALYRYAASGAFRLEWDFAARSGTARVSDFDGRAFGTAPGGVVFDAGAEAREFSGELSGGGLSGELAGGFFRGGADAAAGVGGAWQVGGSDYRAAGTFAAER